MNVPKQMKKVKEHKCKEFSLTAGMLKGATEEGGKEEMNILLWGGRSKSRIIIEMVKEIYGTQAHISGIFDKTLSELPFQSDIELFSSGSELEVFCKKSSHYIVCIGGEHGYARYMTAKKLEEKGLLPLRVISQHSLLDKLDLIGGGIQVMPGAIAHKFSSINEQCILNTNSTVDHECIIGKGVHVMGGAAIAGRVTIGNYSTIGTNATVLPNLVIGENVYVGAGAVVTKNIGSNSVVAGVPAKFLREFKPSIDLSMFS